MTTRPFRRHFLAFALLMFFTSAAQAGPSRVNSVERFGISGTIQPVGLHHGYHIETVAEDSTADKELLKPHDVIVKIDDESIRSVDHLRAVLAEAYADDGEVTITYLRGASLTQHNLKCNLKSGSLKPIRKKRKADPEDDGR